VFSGAQTLVKVMHPKTAL